MSLRKNIIQVFNESKSRELTVAQITEAIEAPRRDIEKEIHKMYFEGDIEPAYKVGRIQLWTLGSRPGTWPKNANR